MAPEGESARVGRVSLLVQSQFSHSVVTAVIIIIIIIIIIITLFL